ncbi:DNA repair endonuclease UVH1 [Tanacetum coccineum]
MGINALCIQSDALNQLCAYSVCALRTRPVSALRTQPVCCLYATSEVCCFTHFCQVSWRCYGSQPVCALRTQSICALCTQPVSALRTQSISALRTQSVCALRTQPLRISRMLVLCPSFLELSLSSQRKKSGGTLTATESVRRRLIRAGNREMSVWAFSDRPNAMVSGFAKAERVLKSLFLRKLHLWPRFQVFVSEDLERKTNKVDVEDLTVENGLFKSESCDCEAAVGSNWHTRYKGDSTYDAVTYLKYLDSLRASESFRSVLLVPSLAAFTISGFPRATNTNGKVVLEEVLEEAPKWKVLRFDYASLCSLFALPKQEILEEIEAERQKQATSADECVTESFQDDNSIVLVACKDEHSCVQLEECHAREWEKYLLSKVQLHALPKRNKNKTQNQKHKGFGVLDGVVPTTPSKGVEGSTSIITQERDALLAATIEIRGSSLDVNEPGPSSVLMKTQEVDSNTGNENTTSGASFLKKHVDTSGSDKWIPPVHFYAYESGQKVLDILKPSAIVVYHPDIAFVREIEVYKAENPSKKVDQVAHGLSRNSASETESPSKLNMVTRKAGGQKEASKETQVIVDMREFMSSLPNVLHQKGMNIIPVTLEVGDYILSPTICVERKSIQDLFNSFASGRLYHQVEMMSRYYQIPVLLIEFSQDKSFSFQEEGVVERCDVRNICSVFKHLGFYFTEYDEVQYIVPLSLRRLPEGGFRFLLCQRIMDGCGSLADLALLPLEKLTELMGGQNPAKIVGLSSM